MKKAFIGLVILILFVLSSCGPKNGNTYKKSEDEKKFETKINRMIKNETNLDGKGMSGEPPLVAAAKKKYLDSVSILLKNGADPNIREAMTRTTPMLQAIRSPGKPRNDEKEQKIVKMLLEKGANVNAQDRLGNTPMHKAASGARIAVLNILLNNGAMVNVDNNLDYTPLHNAAQMGYHNAVKLILEKDAKINAVTRFDLTPLDLALIGKKKMETENKIEKNKAEDKDKDGKKDEEKAKVDPQVDYDRTIKLLKDAGGKKGETLPLVQRRKRRRERDLKRKKEEESRKEREI